MSRHLFIILKLSAYLERDPRNGFTNWQWDSLCEHRLSRIFAYVAGLSGVCDDSLDGNAIGNERIYDILRWEGLRGTKSIAKIKNCFLYVSFRRTSLACVAQWQSDSGLRDLRFEPSSGCVFLRQENYSALKEWPILLGTFTGLRLLPLFAHRARPSPFNCENAYLVFILE